MVLQQENSNRNISTVETFLNTAKLNSYVSHNSTTMDSIWFKKQIHCDVAIVYVTSAMWRRQ